MSCGIPINQKKLCNKTEFFGAARTGRNVFARLCREKMADEAMNIVTKLPCNQHLDFTQHSLSVLSLKSHRRRQNTSHRAISASPLLLSDQLRMHNQRKQVERLKERVEHLAQSRSAKNKSNIIPHRQDYGYYVTGSKILLSDRYDIEDEELIRLRMLAQSRANGSTRASSVNSCGLRIALSRGTSPSPLSGNGVTSDALSSTPLQPSAMVAAEKRRNILERRSQMEDDRLRRKEMRLKKEKERSRNQEWKMRFEKEMEEKYRPKIPEKKNLIFLTDQDDFNHGINDTRMFLTLWMTVEAGEKGYLQSLINEKQEEAFSYIFDEMDKNGDGKIDINELRENLFSVATKDQVKYLLQVFDLNEDNVVEKKEFIAICALNDKLCGLRTESGKTTLALNLQRLAKQMTIFKELFDIIDDDGDGRIQVKEILIMTTTASEIDHNLDEEETRLLLNNMKKNEKGFIDFTSFILFIPFFSRLLFIILNSSLNVRNLGTIRERVVRKYSENVDDKYSTSCIQ